MLRQTGIVLSLFAVFFASGCGGMFHPGPDSVEFKSDPPGAMVSLDGKDVGRTPLKLSVDRHAFLVRMRMPGYREAIAPIQYVPNGASSVALVWWVLYPAGAIVSDICIGIDHANRNDRVAVQGVSVKLQRDN